MRTHPPGTIGVLTGELTRYAAFPMSLVQVSSPAGTHIVWLRTVNIAGGLNQIVRELRGEWLWLMGDDHAFAPDTLERLLAHEVDLVAPLCLRRTPPYRTVVHDPPDATGDRRIWTLSEVPSGLTPVWAIGSAGMLIRRRVFDVMRPPWFEVGRTQSDQMGEDLYFCEKAHAAGFDVWLDGDTAIGHIHPSIITPKRIGGVWHVELNLGGGRGLHLKVDGLERQDALEASVEVADAALVS